MPPVYRYKALDASGRLTEDMIEAASVQMAQKKLKQQGSYVTELKEDTVKRDRDFFPALSKLLYRIPGKDLGLFAKQLGILLGAGIPLNVALSDVWVQCTNPNLKKILGQMKEDIVAGKSLSEAMEEHKNVFPPVYKSMVQVGEATGSYEKTLNRLAELEEKNAELKSKAITALVYPGIMALVSIGVVLFLLTSVVPQIETLFANFKGAELPLPTRIVLGVSNAFRDFWYLMVIGSISAFAGWQSWKQTDKGKIQWDKIRLKIPLMGSIQNKIIVSRFSRNLGILLESSVPLLTALEIIGGTVGSELFNQEIKNAIQEIREGQSMKDSLKHSEILPSMAKGMMAAGEASDKMGDVLLKIADITEAEVDAAVRGLTNALEPIMIVFMGIVVGGIMIAVMMPLYKMSELIK